MMALGILSGFGLLIEIALLGVLIWLYRRSRNSGYLLLALALPLGDLLFIPFQYVTREAASLGWRTQFSAGLLWAIAQGVLTIIGFVVLGLHRTGSAPPESEPGSPKPEVDVPA